MTIAKNAIVFFYLSKYAFRYLVLPNILDIIYNFDNLLSFSLFLEM